MAACYFLFTDVEFSNIDLFTVAISACLNIIGASGLSMGFQCGKGGPVYAVNSLHVVIPLVLSLVIKGLYPTQLQILGIVLGAIGVIITARI